MPKKDKKIDMKMVKSVNKNVRSSVRKLKPILKSIVGKKADEALRDLSFSEKRISKEVKKTPIKKEKKSDYLFNEIRNLNILKNDEAQNYIINLDYFLFSYLIL